MKVTILIHALALGPSFEQRLQSGARFAKSANCYLSGALKGEIKLLRSVECLYLARRALSAISHRT